MASLFRAPFPTAIIISLAVTLVNLPSPRSLADPADDCYSAYNMIHQKYTNKWAILYDEAWKNQCIDPHTGLTYSGKPVNLENFPNHVLPKSAVGETCKSLINAQARDVAFSEFQPQLSAQASKCIPIANSEAAAYSKSHPACKVGPDATLYCSGNPTALAACTQAHKSPLYCAKISGWQVTVIPCCVLGSAPPSKASCLNSCSVIDGKCMAGAHSVPERQQCTQQVQKCQAACNK